MIAEDPPAFTVSRILESMGDLSQERVIAKHAARQSLVRRADQALNICTDKSLTLVETEHHASNTVPYHG